MSNFKNTLVEYNRGGVIVFFFDYFSAILFTSYFKLRYLISIFNHVQSAGILY
jgi:hypothetical protein